MLQRGFDFHLPEPPAELLPEQTGFSSFYWLISGTGPTTVHRVLTLSAF
jgi:hypothetical protein